MDFTEMIIAPATLVNRRGRMLVEKDIESYGKKVCEREGWLFEKFVSPEKRGVPDRLVTAPNIMFFIEFKRPGAFATPAQSRDHTYRRRLGHMVFVVDSYEEMNAVVVIVLTMIELKKQPSYQTELPRRLLK